jgi:aspartyl protease family protein
VNQALSWLFLGVIAVVGTLYFQDLRTLTARALGIPTPQELAQLEASKAAREKRAARASLMRAGAVSLERARDGHYYTSVDINGRSIDVMVDTGASFVSMTYEDARRAGIFLADTDFKYKMQTANGIARSAHVLLDRVEIGPITVRNVRASVSQPGALFQTLLGMSFLGRLERFEMRRGELILQN